MKRKTAPISYEATLQYLTITKASTVKQMYLEQGLTARQICEVFATPYDARLQKAFFRTFGPKGAGHGGPRLNAGNKPGIKFCGRCRKTLGNCICL